VKPLDIGMVDAFGQHLGDHAPLLGDPQAPLGAERFNVDWLVHSQPVN